MQAASENVAENMRSLAAQSVLAAVEQLGAQIHEMNDTARRVREQAEEMAHRTSGFYVGDRNAAVSARAAKPVRSGRS